MIIAKITLPMDEFLNKLMKHILLDGFEARLNAAFADIGAEFEGFIPATANAIAQMQRGIHGDRRIVVGTVEMPNDAALVYLKMQMSDTSYGIVEAQ